MALWHIDYAGATLQFTTVHPFRIKLPDGSRAQFAQWLRAGGYDAAAAIVEPGAKKTFRWPVNDKRWYYRTVYLKSEHWRKLKAKKLTLTPHCERCPSTSNLDVHHLCYRKLYDVGVWDLKTLCRVCHHKAHRKDVVFLFSIFNGIAGFDGVAKKPVVKYRIKHRKLQQQTIRLLHKQATRPKISFGFFGRRRDSLVRSSIG